MSNSGLLIINKPPGMTSRRAVDLVARLERKMKVGHAGTLDPLASGVLVLCVGTATRLIEYVQRMPKLYSATFLLGRESPTEDIEGEVIQLDHPPVPSLDEIVRAAAALKGTILQRPPSYSALKVGGRRSYDLARKGQTVELKPRPVTVHRIEVVGYDYPELKLEVECGAGTYVRSLGRDLAESLGTAAVMSALIRTAIGSFRLEEALDPEQISADSCHRCLLPPIRAVEMLPQVSVSDDEAARIRSGQTIRRQVDPVQSGEWAAVDGAGRLVAILTARGPGRLGPTRNLSR